MSEPQPPQGPRRLLDPVTQHEVEIIDALPVNQLSRDNGSSDFQNLPISDVFRVLRQPAFPIIAITAVMTALAAGLTLLLPNHYTAQVTALPPSDNSGGEGMMAPYIAHWGLLREVKKSEALTTTPSAQIEAARNAGRVWKNGGQEPLDRRLRISRRLVAEKCVW